MVEIIEHARKIDKSDPLYKFRKQFYFGNDDVIYLDGNSLGRLPLESSKKIRQLTDVEWGERLIRSWNEGWYEMGETLGNKLAPLIGVSPGEVIFSESTSTNLFKLAWAALKKQEGRKRIVSDTLNFPTDLYILQGIIKQMNAGHELRLIESGDGIHPDINSLQELLTEDTALLVLSLVTFKGGFLYDMEAVNKLAHEKDILVLWDLSHATGAVEIALNDSKADLAVGCSYKYLNGGPGAPAFLFIRKDLQEELVNPIQGWFGDSAPFDFGLEYQASKGLKSFLVGSPPIISLSGIESGIDILLSAGMSQVRAKNKELTSFLLEASEQHLSFLDVEIASPRNPDHRGSHLSLRHPESWRICQALINPEKAKQVIIPDFRTPDNIRIGISSLYNSCEDLAVCILRIKEVIESKEFLRFPKEKPSVT